MENVKLYDREKVNAALEYLNAHTLYTPEEKGTYEVVYIANADACWDWVGGTPESFEFTGNFNLAVNGLTLRELFEVEKQYYYSWRLGGAFSEALKKYTPKEIATFVLDKNESLEVRKVLIEKMPLPKDVFEQIFSDKTDPIRNFIIPYLPQEKIIACVLDKNESLEVRENLIEKLTDWHSKKTIDETYANALNQIFADKTDPVREFVVNNYHTNFSIENIKAFLLDTNESSSIRKKILNECLGHVDDYIHGYHCYGYPYVEFYSDVLKEILSDKTDPIRASIVDIISKHIETENTFEDILEQIFSDKTDPIREWALSCITSADRKINLFDKVDNEDKLLIFKTFYSWNQKKLFEKIEDTRLKVLFAKELCAVNALEIKTSKNNETKDVKKAANEAWNHATYWQKDAAKKELKKRKNSSREKRKLNKPKSVGIFSFLKRIIDRRKNKKAFEMWKHRDLR